MNNEFLKDISFKELKNALIGQDLNQVPQSWFYIGQVKKYKKGVHRLDILEHKLMIYKSNHKFIAQSRSCLHMNTDLSKGKLKDGVISCPMHNWKYNTKGETKHSCKKLKQYPIEQIENHLFIFIGEKKNFFPFPKFATEEFKNLQALKNPLHFDIGINYFLLSGNGFDLNHFESMHGRVPIKKPTPFLRSKNRICINHEFRNTSNLFLDKVLRTILSPIGYLNFDVVAGNMVLAETKIKNRVSRLLFVLTPEGENQTSVTLIPFVHIKKHNFWHRFKNSISLAIRKVFVKQFFIHEIAQAQEIQFCPENFVPSDRLYMVYFTWFKQYLDGLDQLEETNFEEQNINRNEIN